MDITPFIRELLFGHDCVILPELGGFIVNYSPARVDKITGTFFPPSRQVSFNRNLSHNDGLLIGKISESLKINYVDARRITAEFTSSARRKLDRGEKVLFDMIGVFSTNHEGNIQFEPDRSINYHLDSYGLDTFQLFPIEDYDVRKRILKRDHEPFAGNGSMRKIIRRAAIIIPLLAVLVAVPLKTNLFKTRIDSSTLNPLVTEEFEHNKKAVDEVEKKEESAPVTVAAPITEAPKPVAERAPSKPEVKPEVKISGGYYLITGSFKTQENAISQVNMLKKEGFNPEIYTTANGYFRVCAMVCTDMTIATDKKESIAKRDPGTWVSNKR